jgi:uncharacterized protein YciI
LNIFIVIVSYIASLDEIDEALPDHNAWLDSMYERGVLIASGRQVPRIGGVLLARSDSRGDLERVLETDPFRRRGFSETQIIEFQPSKTAEGIKL